MPDHDARAREQAITALAALREGLSSDGRAIKIITAALVAFAGEERALPSVSVESLKTIEARLLSANARLRGDHPHPWSALALVAWNTVVAEIERVRALRSDAP